MPQLAELKQRELPQDFDIPPAIDSLIHDLMGNYAQRGNILEISGNLAEQPLNSKRHEQYDAILQARDDGRITHEEFTAHLADFDWAIENYNEFDLAFQLTAIGNIRSRFASGDPGDRRIANDEFINSFCPLYGITVNDRSSVFSSEISDPLVQSMVITQMNKVDRDNPNIPEYQQWVLALRYHLLPEDKYFRIRSLPLSIINRNP